MALYLLLAAAAAAVAALPPDNPSALTIPQTSHSFRPRITILVSVLAIVFSVTFLLLLYAKYCTGQQTYTLPISASRNSGVTRAVVDRLPLFRFDSLTCPTHWLECAVCLAPFQAAEALRLLPKCRHAFHVECVDTWLDAHASCPLCRARVQPEDVHLPMPVLLPPAAPAAAGKRVFGRHSSAGEKSSKSRLARAVEGVERWRKDGLLPTEAAAVAGGVRRFSHRIILSGSGRDDGAPSGDGVG